MNWRDDIDSDPAVLTGQPVVRGTRLGVDLILEKLGAGETPEQILSAHPRLTREAIQACLLYAADALRADLVYSVPGEAA
jgi:uncharacterized protein (DUF433 family)